MNTQQFITMTRNHVMGGEHTVYTFPNGYGASVIPVIYFNTGEIVEGWHEVAVLDAQGELTYDTPVTDDTLRVTVEDLPALLERIAGL